MPVAYEVPTDVFRRYADLGYRNIIPVMPPDAQVHPESYIAKLVGTPKDPRGKTPGRKQGTLWVGFKDWTTHVCSDADLAAFASWGANLGIRTGSNAGDVIAIDADVLEPETAILVNELVNKHFGRLPMRVGRAPKALYALRCSDGMAYASIKLPAINGQQQRIEVLTGGKQFVAEGQHPKTKAPYHWPVPIVRFDELPAFSAAQVMAFLNEARALIPGSDPINQSGISTADPKTLLGDLETVKRALAALPNKTSIFPFRSGAGGILTVAYAIKAALAEYRPEIGEALWVEWASKWIDDTGDYPGDENEPDWLRSEYARVGDKQRVGASWLYEMAEKHSDGKFLAASAYFDVIDTEPAAGEGARTIGPLVAQPIDLSRLAALPPRPWLYGYKFQRGYSGFIAAPGGVGKTAYVIAMALACASGQTLLHDAPVKPLKVWIYNLEDGLDEMLRRIKGAMMYYGMLDRDDVLANLRLNSGRDRQIKIVDTGPDGSFRVKPDKAALVAELVRDGIDLLIVDPYLRSHGVSENDNEAQDEVMRLFNEIAEEARVGIVLVHHTKKGAVAGDMDSLRGGSTQIGGARSAFTITNFAKEDAKKFGLTDEQRAQIKRVDDAKNNMAPAGGAEHFRLLSVNLGNGDETYPKGDFVQVAVPWSPPKLEADSADLERIAREIGDAVGLPDGQRYTLTKRGNADLWAGHHIIERLGEGACSETQAQDLLNGWVKIGWLEMQDYTGKQRKKQKGLFFVGDKMSIFG